jgi:hypothetical protein
MAVTIRVVIFWVMTPCGLVSGYKRFEVIYWHHLQTQLEILSQCLHYRAT